MQPPEPSNNPSTNAFLGQPDTAKLSADASASPFANQPRKKLGLMLGLSVVFIAVGVVLFGHLQAASNNPDKLFWEALQQTTVTQSVSQRTTSTDSDGQILYDIADPKQAKVSTTSDYGGVVIDGYGTLTDTYIRFKSSEATTKDPSAKAVLDKWVQLRKDGVLPDAAELANLGDHMDPRSMLFGDIIFGNFSAKDQQSLLDYMRKNKVYTFDKNNVKKIVVNGKNAYEYPVTEHTDALLKFNEFAAPMFGLKPEDINTSLSQRSEKTTREKWTIDAASKQIVKVQAEFSGTTFTTIYSDYNTTKVGGAPKPDMQWSDFHKIIVSLQTDQSASDLQ